MHFVDVTYTTNIMKDLDTLGCKQIGKVIKRHGTRDPFFGVKVAT